MLKARLLGAPYITLGTDAFVAPLSGRALALFAYLCVMRQPQSRTTLADLLWDNQPEQEAKSNLRYLLRNLKKALGDYVDVDGQTIALNPTLPQWFDTTIFATYLVQNTTAAAIQVEPILLEELLNLYAGEFLAGFHVQDAPNFERWLSAQRHHFHDLMVYGLQLSTQQHLTAGDYETGLAINRYLLTLEPWREETHRQRMVMLAASGQRSAALMQYEICCQTLEKELDVPPMDETTSLYIQIKSGQWFLDEKAMKPYRAEPVAVSAYPRAGYVGIKSAADQTAALASAIPPAVPLAISPAVPPVHVDLGAMPGTNFFVGRKREFAGLKQWVETENSHVVAILGLGGQGKSALAAYFVRAQVAQDQQYQDQRESTEFIHKKHATLQTLKHQESLSASTTGIETTGIEAIIWRSLAQSPTCIDILQDWIQQLCGKPCNELSTNFDQLITILFAILKQRRCLLVLDGMEAVLQCDRQDDQAEVKAYETLLRLFIERQHRSCLLLTSRVCPSALTHLDKRNDLIHCLALEGLAVEASMQFLAQHGLDKDPAGQQKLHQQYAGNPLLLRKAADRVHDLFGGDVAAFLQEDLCFFGDIGATVAAQISHLSPLELHIMQVLVEARQPLLRQTLWEKLPLSTTKADYYHALHNLQRAYWIQQKANHFEPTLLPGLYLKAHAALY